MPWMPILSTPAFSEICSPSPARSSGTPAVTAPNNREVRNGSVSRASTLSGLHAAAAQMVEILHHRKEYEQQGHEDEYVVLRHADAPCGALAADHQRREE